MTPQLVLTGILIVLCFLWIAKQAVDETPPLGPLPQGEPERRAKADRHDRYMLVAFGVLMLGIVLTG